MIFCFIHNKQMCHIYLNFLSIIFPIAWTKLAKQFKLLWLPFRLHQLLIPNVNHTFMFPIIIC